MQKVVFQKSQTLSAQDMMAISYLEAKIGHKA
jgi:hypothetical protein